MKQVSQLTAKVLKVVMSALNPPVRFGEGATWTSLAYARIAEQDIAGKVDAHWKAAHKKRVKKV